MLVHKQRATENIGSATPFAQGSVGGRRGVRLSWMATAACLLGISCAGCGGTGTPVLSPASIGVSVQDVNFGNQMVGTSSTPHNISLAITGGAPATIEPVAIVGDFTATSGCSSILPGGSSCNIALVFTPITSGTRAGTLTIINNDTGNIQIVTLTGVGITLHNVVLTWDDSDSSVIGYFVYQSTDPIGPYTRANSAPVEDRSFTYRIPGGQTYFYVVTAIDHKEAESLPSNVAVAVVPP